MLKKPDLTARRIRPPSISSTVLKDIERNESLQFPGNRRGIFGIFILSSLTQDFRSFRILKSFQCTKDLSGVASRLICEGRYKGTYFLEGCEFRDRVLIIEPIYGIVTSRESWLSQ